MGFGWQELIIILLIVGLIFGTKKLKNIGSDLGGAVKGFKEGVKEDPKKEEEQKLFQVGFLEILLILVVGLFIVGPTRLPDVVKFVVKVYKKIQLSIANFKNDLESEIGTDEIKKDVFNEMRMEELNLSGTSKKDE